MTNMKAPFRMPTLPYRNPVEGRDLWILDNVLPNAKEVRERCLAKTDWTYGFPYRDEGWPGMRAIPALLPEEFGTNRSVGQAADRVQTAVAESDCARHDAESQLCAACGCR